jgi:RecB family exonuclease
VPKKTSRFARLTSWSFSVYQQWLKCPLSVCFDKIQRVRIQEPPSSVLAKGNYAHKVSELFVGSRAKTPPPLVGEIASPVKGDGKIKVDLRPVKGLLDRLRKNKAKVELEWAFDRAWNPVAWKDWDRAWLRMKIDAMDERLKPPAVDIIDYKTGRVHDEHKQQRSLYATGGLQLVQIGQLANGSKDAVLTASHVYLDWPDTKADEVFKLKDLPGLKREWLARTKQMLEDEEFRPRTGYHCRYCRFAKSKGGPCPEDM